MLVAPTLRRCPPSRGRLNPHGQLGGDKLGKGEAERRLRWLLEIAAEARANPADFDLTHDGLALEWG